MRTLYSHCPNPVCRYHEEQAPPRWYCKWGYFRERVNGQLVPRYRCRYCRRSFSASTFNTTYRQKRPDVNEPLRRALAEGIGIRPAARSFQISKKTVLRRLKQLGELSKEICHQKRENGDLKTSYVQFDEIVAYERTQCLPITIAFAVRPKSGEIITAVAGIIPCENALQEVSLKNYGRRENHREKVVRQMLKDVALCVRDKNTFTIASDGHTQYPEWVEAELPFAKFERHSGEDLKAREKAMATVDWNLEPIDYSKTDNYGPFFVKKQKNGKRVVRAYDPLFAINQKCMKLRASLSRMRRDHWGYTQKIENLQLHLWLFIALHNGYELPGTKPKSRQIAEPKVPPSKLDDACPIDFSRVPAAQDSFCAIQRTSVVTIRKQFVLAHGLLEKRFCRAYLDLERRIVAFTFLDAQEEGAIKVTMQESTAYINIHSFLKRKGMSLVQPGPVPILSDEEQKCVFVMLESAVVKKNV